MKYLCQRIPLGDFGSTHDEAPGFDSAPSRCEAYLRRWAQDQELTIASFYFWSAGSEIQASRNGLYCTLLFQMLQQRPELISRISPERWSVLCVFDTDLEDFTEDDLVIMFHRTVAEICSTGKLCLFIDGLDEFHGQPDELVQLFRTIVMDNPTVKICVASRPWVIFEQAFGNKPHLMLEYLTYKDIKEYITSHFNKDSNFCLIQSQQPQQAEQLIEEIMRKAEGIFLWVHLVVFSLLVGIKPEDNVLDLQRRLETLEPGLQGLYDRMVDDLNPSYLEQAIEYFQLIRSSFGDPSALLFSFAMENDPDFAVKLPISTLSTEQIQLRVEATRRRINSRCKGLLELSRGAPSADNSVVQVPTVQFLHRTFKDYLDTPGAQRKLTDAVDGRFDPHFKLCKASLALYKVSAKGETRNRGLLNPDDFGEGQNIPALSRCMMHAAEVHQDHILGIINVLDELEESQKILSPRLFLDSHRVKPCILFTSRFGPSFLSLAVKYEVVEYVKAKLEPGCLVDRSDGCMLHNHKPRSKRRYKQPKTWLHSWSPELEMPESPKWPLLLDAINSKGPKSLSMASMLLENGAGPNFFIDSKSASFQVAGPLPAPERDSKHHYEYNAGLRAETVAGGTLWQMTLQALLITLSELYIHRRRSKQLGSLARLMVKHGAPADREFLQTVLAALLKCNARENRELGPISQVDLTSVLSRELQATEQDLCLGNYTIGTTPESSSWKLTDWFPEYAGRPATQGWQRTGDDDMRILVQFVGLSMAVSGCQIM